MTRPVRNAWLLVWFLVGSLAAAEGQYGDARFLDGLRRRQLFELAETYCTTRLQDPQISDVNRAEYVIELSLTLTDWAVNSPPDRRHDLWRRAHRTAAEFIAGGADNPRLPLVRYQAAIAFLTGGELPRQEAELVTDGALLFEDAKTNLRLAIARLEELERDIGDEIRQRNVRGDRNPARSDPSLLTDYQLAFLQRDVRYQLARAFRNQGQCYPPGSPDRTNSLTQAVETLNALVGGQPADMKTFQSRLDDVVCHRLLEDHATARRMLDTLLVDGTPPEIRLRAKAEEIRLFLDRNELPQAIAVLSQPREIDGVTSADLDYARLEICLAAWRAADQAKNGEEAARWQTEATAMVASIERLHGPYWTRRAELLLAGYVESSTGGGDLVMRVRAAESSYRSGRIDDALAAYDRARQLAIEMEDDTQAFDLGFTAAAIVREAGRRREALDRFRSLALGMRSSPKAPGAHRAAIYHAGQLALDGDPESLETYVELLEEHLATWPSGPEADGVRRQLGGIHKHRSDWPSAVAVYRAVGPDFVGYETVVESATACYLVWLEELAAKALPTDEIATAAAEWLESLVFSTDGSLPERWSPLARQAVLRAAQIRMDYTSSGYAPAERLLAAALNSTEPPLPEWTSAAQTLLVFAFAGQGRRPEAAARLAQISQGPTDGLLDMLDGMTRLAADAGPNVRLELANLQLGTVELLRPRRAELSRDQLQKVDRVTAEALANTGRVDEAVDIYRRLARALPNDGDVQEGYARLLAAQPDRASAQAALAKWRELAKRTPEGTARWFRAKLAVARLHLRMNDKPKAESMIGLIEVLHPEMGGPVIKAEFDRVREECRR